MLHIAIKKQGERNKRRKGECGKNYSIMNWSKGVLCKGLLPTVAVEVTGTLALTI